MTKKSRFFGGITENYLTDFENILRADEPSNCASNNTKHRRLVQKNSGKKCQNFSLSEQEKNFLGNFQNFRVSHAIYRFSCAEHDGNG